MGAVELLFKMLLDAYDMFLDTEEKEIGCLTAEEHQKAIDDRNYYADLCIKKTQVKEVKTEKKHNESLHEIIVLNDEEDDGGADVCSKKRTHEMER